MKAINWLNIQITSRELRRLNEDIRESVPTKGFLEKFVNLILEDYPWDGRPDTIDSFHPSESYKNGQWISLSIHDKEQILPPVFQIAQVIQAELAENPVQGRFQVLHLNVNGVLLTLACGIPNASFAETKIDVLSSEQRAWLAKWIVNAYSSALKYACSNSISKGELKGYFQDGLYIPVISQGLTTNDKLSVESSASLAAPIKPIYKAFLKKIFLFIKRLFRRER